MSNNKCWITREGCPYKYFFRAEWSYPGDARGECPFFKCMSHNASEEELKRLSARAGRSIDSCHVIDDRCRYYGISQYENAKGSDFTDLYVAAFAAGKSDDELQAEAQAVQNWFEGRRFPCVCYGDFHKDWQYALKLVQQSIKKKKGRHKE